MQTLLMQWLLMQRRQQGSNPANQRLGRCGSIPPGNFLSDLGNQFFAIFYGVIERVKAANQHTTNAHVIVLGNCLRHLLRRTYEGSRVAAALSCCRDGHP